MDFKEVFLTNLNMVFNVGKYFICDEHRLWTKSTHTFSQCKFYYITKGECTITVSEHKYIGRAGDWFFIPAGCPHSYSSINGKSFEKFWIHFDIYPDTSLLSSLSLPSFVKINPRSAAHKLFDKIIKLSESNNLTDKIATKSYLTMLFAQVIDIAYPNGIEVKNESNTKIDEILKYIISNINKPLTVNDIASAFYMHPNHFFRFFKDKTGQTPAKYIKMRKMEIAKRYLEDTEMSVSEIMYQIGENDLCSFSKQFKSAFSYSPREYRKYFRNT